jgi:hypothetical protein
VDLPVGHGVIVSLNGPLVFGNGLCHLIICKIGYNQGWEITSFEKVGIENEEERHIYPEMEWAFIGRGGFCRRRVFILRAE